MRIGIFTNAYKPEVSGVVTSITNFRQELVKQGHTVYIFAPEASDYEDEEYGIFRYPAIKLSKSINLPLAIPVSPFVNWVVPRLKLDILHSQHPVLIGEEAINFARELNLPHLFTHHSQYEVYSEYVPFNQNIVKTLTREVVRAHMARSVRVITPTKSIQEMLSEQHPDLKDRYVTLPSPVDLAPFKTNQLDENWVRRKYHLDGKFVFVTVARMTKEKRYPVLLDAFHQVCGNFPMARLLIVGGGADRERLEAQVHEMNMADKVIFTGRVDYDVIPHHMAAASAFAFASTSETQGLVLVEAMATGLPVIAVDAPGNRDVVRHQANGFLTEDSSQALADAMKHIIQNKSLREKLSEGARKTSLNYSPPVLTKRLVEIYQETIDQYAREPIPYKRFSQESDLSRQFPPQWLNELAEENVDSLKAFWQKISDSLKFEADN